MLLVFRRGRISKRLWEWVRENSAALQGVAALVVIFGALFYIPQFITHLFRPDLSVIVRINNSTVPPDLIEFNDAVSSLFVLEADKFNEIKKQNKDLADILDNPILRRLIF